MKLSINSMSAFVSFATFLLASHMATASSRLGQKSKKTNDIRNLAQVALSDAFLHRQLQVSQHKDLILQLSEKKNKKRHLEEALVSSACEEEYTDLFLNNTQLGDAAEAYYDSYLATLELADIDTSCIVSDETLDIVCDFRQSNSIAGQQEFELACTDLGASVVEFNFDIDCGMQILGTNASLEMYFTDPVDCVPADCEDEVQSVIEDAVMQVESQLESAFVAVGASSVECNM
jgi:hypothetical protein